MSAIGWFKRIILGTDPSDGGLGGPDNLGDEDDGEKINVFGGTKQFYTEDDDYPYAENYTSASGKKGGNETGTTKSQNRKMQSGNVTPATGRSNLSISLMMPKCFEDDEIHRTIQMLRDERHTVTLNLEGYEEERSSVPSVIGLAGGVNSHTDSVSQSIHILVPENMELPGGFEGVESQVARMSRSRSV